MGGGYDHCSKFKSTSNYDFTSFLLQDILVYTKLMIFIARKYWFPRMRNRIKYFVQTYNNCQRNKMEGLHNLKLNFADS